MSQLALLQLTETVILLHIFAKGNPMRNINLRRGGSSIYAWYYTTQIKCHRRRRRSSCCATSRAFLITFQCFHAPQLFFFSKAQNSTAKHTNLVLELSKFNSFWKLTRTPSFRYFLCCCFWFETNNKVYVYVTACSEYVQRNTNDNVYLLICQFSLQLIHVSLSV